MRQTALIAVLVMLTLAAAPASSGEQLAIAVAGGNPVLLAADSDAASQEMETYLRRFLRDRGFPVIPA